VTVADRLICIAQYRTLTSFKRTRTRATCGFLYRFRVKSAERRGVVAYHMPCVQALLAAFR
jgi:predicted NAD/FAD-binding protein